MSKLPAVTSKVNKPPGAHGCQSRKRINAILHSQENSKKLKQSENDLNHNSLSDYLLSLYNDGVLKTNHIQKAAACALDGSGYDAGSALEAFAKLGREGMWAGNLFRDFNRRIGRSSRMPDLYEASIPGWDKDRACPKELNMRFMLPHELLATVAQSNVTEWTRFEDNVKPL